MNKTAHLELHRIFLIDALPEPLTRASSHLQIYDNYIEGTRLRTRSIRDPYSKAWTYILQQRIRTLIEQQLHRLRRRVMRGHHQRRGAAGRFGINVGAFVQ